MARTRGMGGRLVSLLVQRGVEVRALARSQAGLEKVKALGATPVPGDVALAVDLDDEHDRADLDRVTGRQDCLLNRRAVEERAVGTAEVFELERVAVADQPAVFA